MTVIAIGGDAATTTALALSAAWPDRAGVDQGTEDHATRQSAVRHRVAADRNAGDDRGLVVFEADPTGGSLAAWLDTPLDPSLSSVVTALHQSVSTGATPGALWTCVDTMVRRSPTGVRFVPAPFRAREARSPILEADQHLLPLMASLDHTVALVDVGSLDPLRLPPGLGHAELVVVVHRQDAASPAASTVRIERLAEVVEALRAAGSEVALAIIGEDPFPIGEVVSFAAPGAAAWSLAVDPLAAQVLAGRTGVSQRRMARLPLMRTAAAAASDLARRAPRTGQHIDRRSSSTATSRM